MTHDPVTALLPLLSRSLRAGFNVFDVMHHGMHEKQLSNACGWLLDPDGTHGLGAAFQRIFVDEVNRGLLGSEPVPHGPFVVSQEVNTSDPGEDRDIADLVLASDQAVLVVENYYTSDGHGHDYHRYLEFSRRGGRQGVVVLLCRDEDSSAQTGGWEHAAVVTYATLVERLHRELDGDRDYQERHPQAWSFIEQMHRKFVTTRSRVEDSDVLEFVIAMCATGEAGRYGQRPQDLAAAAFADAMARQAVERFGEGRELLQRVKGRLVTFCDGVLRRQLEATFGQGCVGDVGGRYAGIYQWTVGLHVGAGTTMPSEPNLQVKFGPSAWYANEQDRYWKTTVDRTVADYSHLFLTDVMTRDIRQSVVTLQEVLDGIPSNDHRLHHELAQLLRSSR